MSLVKKPSTHVNRSVAVNNFSIRPPKFGVTFFEDIDLPGGIGENTATRTWQYITPNGSMLELGRVIHAWLRHALLPSKATETTKTEERIDNL